MLVINSEPLNITDLSEPKIWLHKKMFLSWFHQDFTANWTLPCY